MHLIKVVMCKSHIIASQKLAEDSKVNYVVNICRSSKNSFPNDASLCNSPLYNIVRENMKTIGRLTRGIIGLMKAVIFTFIYYS